MKKMLIVSVGIIVVLLTIIGVAQLSVGSDRAQLSEDDVLEKVGNEYPGDVVSVAPQNHNGQSVYAVEIANDEGVYDLMVDAAEGDIMNLALRESQNETEEASEEETNETEETESESDEADPRPISAAEAVQIATDEVEGVIEELELELEDGSYYEIDIETNHGDVEVDVDAYTGEILVFSYDD